MIASSNLHFCIVLLSGEGVENGIVGFRREN